MLLLIGRSEARLRGLLLLLRLLLLVLEARCTERGVLQRRVLAVPVGNCNGTVNGQGSVPLLGFACFFLLQPAEQQGNDSFVYGQFVADCAVTGTPGPNPVAGSGPHIIQLYDDPTSNDS